MNDRHRQVHYRQVADDILSVLPPVEGATVLDYGCGDALDAPRVAARARCLLLFDAAPEVRHRLAVRFAGHPAIRVIDETGLGALPPDSVDLIVVNSVIQYLDRAELDGLLATSRRLVRPGGLLAIADVIPPDAGAVADVAALLRSGLRHGFLAGALAGLVATVFSDYRRLRRSIGLSTYAEADMRQILATAGFAAERRARNFGFNPARMTFLARKPP